ncbi:LOW QUALITY PROTEIN: 28S ribosomal protein S29, mitochondrial-like [Acropora millepora]|uniref:LOW QUALITY PROTEIN: 28S ribosomal protein S29, mitochondrial-like n=1 Tax=Acropora millepora TaxID=45264 RepID=UPI001CF3E960|nr:LOW QUALITY PROTEIN: 28S ribosomal protein S29, mitochondrial-like [Acropora millepora]
MTATLQLFSCGRNVVISGNHLFEEARTCYLFFTRWKPMMRDFHRCVSSEAHQRKVTTTETNQEPEIIDLGEINPASHTRTNIGQFYTIPKDISTKVLSSFLTKKFQSECNLMGDTSLMIRQPALQVLSHLQEMPQGANSPPKFIFYGMDARGKSLSLAHVIHYCYSAGWFILPVPRVFNWVHGQSELQMSTFHDGRFDQPKQASAWLQLCRMINNKFFTELKASQQYLFGKRDSTKQGVSLGKIVDMGLQRPNYATDAVGIVVKEIKNNTSLRVLYAVNEFNGFFLKTSFKDANQKYIKPRRLSLVHHFTELLDSKDGLKTGAMVFALSRTGMERSHVQSCEIEDLLGKSGLSAVSDFTAVEVPRYSQQELESCLRFYRKRGILSKDLNSRLIKEVSFLTNCEPKLVSDLCRLG